VGLVTGACLAHFGYRVTCVDNDEGRIAELEKGRMSFYEPGLGELVSENFRRGYLSFSANLPEAVRDADVLFIAVGTPQGNDGSADLSDVGTVARSVGRAGETGDAIGGRRDQKGAKRATPRGGQ
jgi:UDPglucose 6-dehydrogenase